MRFHRQLLVGPWLLAAFTACEVEPAPQEETQTQITGQCSDHTPTRRPFFGDLHVHTSNSFDAYAFETRNGPREAYAFARDRAELGLAPLNRLGNPTRTQQLERPLDFAAVTDHSEYLGEVSICTTPGARGYFSSTCRTYRDDPLVAFVTWGARLTQQSPSRLLVCGWAGVDCPSTAQDVWQEQLQATQDFNTPCSFTTFPAYEWTGTTGGNNLHRNVIFKNQNVPGPTSYFEQPTAQGLWTQLNAQCGSGCEVLAIPHNSNASGGQMFTTPANEAEAQLRAQTEPLTELIQHKGASECSPLSGEEGCNFEALNGADEQPETSFVREALTEGLRLQAQLNTNPFKMGFIGSTDTHNGTPGAVEENDFKGHLGNNDGAPITRAAAQDFGPGGLAVLWAEENTRGSLFAAMKRKETYSTSGTRIILRFFGGANLPNNLCSRANAYELAYQRGVPMGGDLSGPSAPRFFISALWDPGTATRPGTLLQQLQIVKVSVDAQGQSQTQVFEVAGDANNGATVNTQTCQASGPGAQSLCAVWSDPTFVPGERAFYYARALENPSCRWTAYECQRSGRACDADVLEQQERAVSSPIWYSP